MSRVVAIQPDMLGGPEVEGHAYEPAFFAWSWCGMFFPPSREEVRQYKMQRADTLTAKESADLDRMVAVREKSDADPVMSRFNRDIIERGAEFKSRTTERAGVPQESQE